MTSWQRRHPNLILAVIAGLVLTGGQQVHAQSSTSTTPSSALQPARQAPSATTVSPGAQDVLTLLGNSQGRTRFAVFNSLNLHKKLPGPYSPADVNAFIAGMESFRGRVVAKLDRRIEGSLNRASVLALLADTRDQNRFDILYTLSLHGRLPGPYSPADVNAFVAGMESFRGRVVATLDRRIEGSLNRDSVLTLLADTRDQNRFDILYTLSLHGRLPGPYSPEDVNAFIANMESFRGRVVALLGRRISAGGDSTAQSTAPSAATESVDAAITGVWQGQGRQASGESWSIRIVLAAGGSSIAYDSLNCGGTLELVSRTARSLEFRESITYGRGTCMDGGTVVLELSSATTVSYSWRNADPRLNARGELTRSAATSAPSATNPPLLGSATPASTRSASSIRQRIQRYRRLAEGVEPYLYGGTSFSDLTNIVAMDLPRLIGLQDIRALYEQNYFAALQYRLLALAAFNKADRYLANGDLERANHFVDLGVYATTQERSSFSAASAAYSRDTSRATTYVRAVYSISKYASRFVARMVPGAPGAVDALWMVVDAGVTASESGIRASLRELIVNALMDYIMSRITFADLDNMTMNDYLEHGAGRLLNNAGVVSDLRQAIRNPALRRAMVAEVKSLVVKASGGVLVEQTLEDSINAAIDLIDQNAQGLF